MSDMPDQSAARREMESEVHKGTEEDIHAGQSSSPTTGAGAVVGGFEPNYEGGDPFLGEGAHVVSGDPRPGPQVDDDMRDSPALVLDLGRDPHGGGKDVGVVRSHEAGDAGQGSNDLRTYEDQGPEGTR